MFFFFFFQAEDGIRDSSVTGVQTCALPICNFAMLALVVTMGALTMLAIGFAAASFVKKSEAANSVLLLVSFPMMFLGGSYFPVNSAPSFLQPVIHALPLYYLNDALRQVIYNGAGWRPVHTTLLALTASLFSSLQHIWRP